MFNSTTLAPNSALPAIIFPEDEQMPQRVSERELDCSDLEIDVPKMRPRRLIVLTSCVAGVLLCTTTAVSQSKGQTRSGAIASQDESSAGKANSISPSLADVKAAGALRSRYTKRQPYNAAAQSPQPQLATFRDEIEPILQQACVQCHSSDTQEGEFRIDTLDPNLLQGGDVSWWLEVLDVLSNGEMPPEDEAELTDEDRGHLIQWLSSEIQVASALRRSDQGHSSFRRMTRYEYNYALQDLLGLSHDFAKDLPPETASEDGFQNSSEVLQMSAMQFAYYRDLSRAALTKATVRGERPEPLYWGVTMESAAARMWAVHDAELARRKRQTDNDPERLKRELEVQIARYAYKGSNAHFKDLSTGKAIKASWNYRGAKHAWAPTTTRPEVPVVSPHVAVIPAKQQLIVELGNAVPDTGTLRVRVRASRGSGHDDRIPSLRLKFGHQASNNSSAEVTVSDHDVAILAAPEEPQFYQWDIPLSEITRNPLRRTAKMGDTPNPSEYLKLYNSAISQGDIQIDYVEITAPAYDQWPPESHTRIFIDSPNQADETAYAREILTHFMSRAWRRDVTDSEIDQKLVLFSKFRPGYDDFQDAMTEVLATVLSSPSFLYLVHPDRENSDGFEEPIDDFELATRLSMFLWCSTPDQGLLDLAANGKLSTPEILASQTKRMLADARCSRFSKHFVRGWLGMQLLDYLNVDRKAHPQFDVDLKEAMQTEPVAFFHEVLQQNHSVIDFIHADYTMANERLAKHYGLPELYGNDFRRVTLRPEDRRGGLLTQAGLLAMNSDGKDSHPLKRGIWMLQSLLNDPPPPPPPAVPEIDLADPEIAKMTLKQRIEDHRNHPACMSCHAKIDPWGIAFEHYDAVGGWRTQINGAAVDASSLLFNKQKLDGMDGLKRFLLANRQDQFARAMVHKLTTYALGRPLTFSDRSEVDKITAEFRQGGDGLADLLVLIVTSKLFQSK
jgi:mono/diheme cytochrome c family protein